MRQQIAGDGDCWLLGNDDPSRPRYDCCRRIAWEPPYCGVVCAYATPTRNGWEVYAGNNYLRCTDDGLSEADAVQRVWQLAQETQP